MHRTRQLTQAALEHLESIIIDPYHPDGKNGINGAGEDVESEGDGGH
jgi:nucleotide-sensitive chloride channel 1A